MSKIYDEFLKKNDIDSLWTTESKPHIMELIPDSWNSSFDSYNPTVYHIFVQYKSRPCEAFCVIYRPSENKIDVSHNEYLTPFDVNKYKSQIKGVEEIPENVMSLFMKHISVTECSEEGMIYFQNSKIESVDDLFT